VNVSNIVTQIETCARQILDNSATPQLTKEGKQNSAPAKMDDTAIRRAWGYFPVTSLETGIRATITASPN
jgi:hypothetical protein